MIDLLYRLTMVFAVLLALLGTLAYQWGWEKGYREATDDLVKETDDADNSMSPSLSYSQSAEESDDDEEVSGPW